MKVVILAGGLGTRLASETEEKPKALVEIGGRPIIWHLMAGFAHFGFRDFLVATGHKGEQIEAYFRSEALHGHDRSCLGHLPASAGWSVEVRPTGDGTSTGGRLRRLRPELGGDTFILCYCDGLADLDPRDLLVFHRRHGRLATVAAVHPPSRFGQLALDGDRVTAFREKATDLESWINGGFFVLEPGALDAIQGDDTAWEREPIERLARDGELMAYRHESFWQCMDTLDEKQLLEKQWASGRPPWNVWRA